MVTTGRSFVVQVIAEVEGQDDINSLADSVEDVGKEATDSAAPTDKLAGSTDNLTGSMLKGVVVGGLLGAAMGFAAANIKDAFAASVTGSEAFLRLGDTVNSLVRAASDLTGLPTIMENIADAGDEIANALQRISNEGVNRDNVAALSQGAENLLGSQRLFDPNFGPTVPNILAGPIETFTREKLGLNPIDLSGKLDDLSEKLGVNLDPGVQHLFPQLNLPLDLLRKSEESGFTNFQKNVGPDPVDNPVLRFIPTREERNLASGFDRSTNLPSNEESNLTSSFDRREDRINSTPQRPNVTIHFNGTVVDDNGLNQRIRQVVEGQFRNPSSNPVGVFE